MINTKQVYDNIPTVNKPEIERVFNEMMDKLKRPRKKFISLDSYKSGSEYINWDYSYLKMRNPSINTYHIEGVGNECQTVAGALAYRMSRVTDKGIVISENGQDWYQQGDVIVYPKGAKVLKPVPVILT